MRIPLRFCLILAATALVLAGCSKSSTIDTTPLQNSFKSAPAAAQTSADKVVAAVKAKDYPGALTELQTLATNAKLTPEQQQAVKDVMAQVQKTVSESVSKVKAETTKAVEDVKPTLPK